MTSKPIKNIFLAALLIGHLSACATAGGVLIGAGIGALAGDVDTGMAVGATTGAVIDVFGR